MHQYFLPEVTTIIRSTNSNESTIRLNNPRLFLINSGNKSLLKIKGANITRSPNVTAITVVNSQSPPLYILHVISKAINDSQKAANVQILLCFFINNGRFKSENTINSDVKTIKDHVGL